MKLVKVTCEVRFAERMKLLGNYETLHQELLKQEPKNVQNWLVPGMKLQDKERKRIMVVDPSRSTIDVEQPPNIGHCKDLVVQFFKSVNGAFKIPKVIRWGVRSTWIEEYKGPFKDLLIAYKKNVFNYSKMSEKADDVGIIFDYCVEEKVKLSLTTGPMELTQLKGQFLTFEPVDIPPVFIYVDVDKGNMKEEKFSLDYLGKYLLGAIEEGGKLAQEVVSNIRSKK